MDLLASINPTGDKEVTAIEQPAFPGEYVELAKKHLKEITNLKAKLHDLQRTNTDLEVQLRIAQSELKDTQALLGQAVVYASKQDMAPLPTAGPSTIAKATSKRARSPSLEIIERPPVSKKAKAKGPEIAAEAISRCGSGKQRLVPYVSLTSRKGKIQIKNPPNNISNFESEKIVQVAEISKTMISKPEKPQKVVSDVVKEKSAVHKPTLPTVPIKYGKPPKKHADVFSLPRSITELYLQGATTLEISPPALDIEVPRMFLRLAYGGSDQQFLQFIQPNSNPSGTVLRRLVFPMMNMNPSMPSAPGQPGLVFASRHEILSNPPWTLFCKRRGTKAVWSYLGEYESALVGRLTPEQFKSQPLVVRRRWADLITTQRKFDCYVEMRARIALRTAKIIPRPDDDKGKEDEIVQAEVAAIKLGNGRDISEDEIITAFSNGDEGVDIIRMICVEYDHVFANDIKAKFANYDSLVAAAKKKNGGLASRSTTADSSSTKSKIQRAKAKAATRSVESEDETDSDDDMASPVVEVPQLPTPVKEQRQRKASRKLLESRK